MNNASHIMEPGVRAAAAFILELHAARWFQRLAVGHTLDTVPVDVFASLAVASRTLLERVEAAEDAALVDPSPGLLRATYVDTIRLDLRLATLVVLGRDRASRASGALSAAGAGTGLFGHDTAHVLLGAVAGCIREQAGAEASAAQSPPDHQESTS